MLIDSLKGAKYFASLDLFSGYHQVSMKPEDQEKTAFAAGPLGFYQYSKMPFGLNQNMNSGVLCRAILCRIPDRIILSCLLCVSDD